MAATAEELVERATVMQLRTALDALTARVIQLEQAAPRPAGDTQVRTPEKRAAVLLAALGPESDLGLGVIGDVLSLGMRLTDHEADLVAGVIRTARAAEVERHVRQADTGSGRPRGGRS